MIGVSKLKLKIGKVAIEGKPEEISQFIDRGGLDKLHEGAIGIDQLKFEDELTERKREYSPKVEVLKKKMPSVGQIVNYIRTKPDFRHTVPELAEKLFGEEIKSYGETQYIYVQLAMKAGWARKRIEREQDGQGVWRAKLGLSNGRNARIKTYIFQRPDVHIEGIESNLNKSETIHDVAKFIS